MGTSAFSIQAQQPLDDYHARIDRIMSMNPGVNFLRPKGWYGNRPVTAQDGPEYDAGLASMRWMIDPAGMAGTSADIARNYVLTDSPTGPESTRIPQPYSWEINNPYAAPKSTVGQRHVYFYDNGPGGGGGQLEGYQLPDGTWVDETFTVPVAPPWWAFFSDMPGRNGITGQPVTREETAASAPSQVIKTTTPAPVFTLPAQFVPPLTPTGPNVFLTPPGPAQLAPTTDKAGERYLVNGKLMDGNGTVLNANRPADAPTQTMTGDLGATNPAGAPQVLPTNNTTATAPATDWKKYLPYGLAILAMLLLIFAARKRSS